MAMTVSDFSVTCPDKKLQYKLNLEKVSCNRYILNFSSSFSEEIAPAPICIEWKIPAGNILSIWGPMLGFSRFFSPSWHRTKNNSNIASGAPILSLVNHDGSNACTIATSDPNNPISIGAGYSDNDSVVYCSVTLFSSYYVPISKYDVNIWIDCNTDSFSKSIQNVNHWWENDCNYHKPFVPKNAYLPIDSAWYSFQRSINETNLLEECKLSSNLGMKTLIVDDGWYTTQDSPIFQYCGDWEVEPTKFPDMKRFVDSVHRLDMKVMLWFSVFLSIYSKAYQHFKDKVLPNKDGAFVADFRYRDVRDYLKDKYVSAVRDYGLDGLKIDFVDLVVLSKDAPPANDNMDIPDLGKALDTFLLETKKELSIINPDIMIEFRQSYIGPSVLQYGNMIRVGDCPHDSMRNRTGILNLRLTSGNVAVHSDMLTWSKDAPAQEVARQMISTLLGVPQVSVRLKEYPARHHSVIAYWLDFYHRYLDVLHSEDLEVLNPELSYTQARVKKDGCTIAVNYANVPFTVEPVSVKKAEYILINSSDTDSAILCVKDNLGACKISIVDCDGTTVSEETEKLSAGIKQFRVPVCGLMIVTPITD